VIDGTVGRRAPPAGERWTLIEWFEADCGESRYPKESIRPDNIMVKLKANAEQNATAM
jgi:hypothetical protein